MPESFWKGGEGAWRKHQNILIRDTTPIKMTFQATPVRAECEAKHSAELTQNTPQKTPIQKIVTASITHSAFLLRWLPNLQAWKYGGYMECSGCLQFLAQRPTLIPGSHNSPPCVILFARILPLLLSRPAACFSFQYLMPCMPTALSCLGN